MIDLSIDWRKHYLRHSDNSQCWCKPYRFWFCLGIPASDSDYLVLNLHSVDGDFPEDILMHDVIQSMLGEG